MRKSSRPASFIEPGGGGSIARSSIAAAIRLATDPRSGDTPWRPLGGGGRRASCSVLLADLRPGDRKFDFLAGLQRGEAVLEVLGSLDHGSVLFDIDEDCSQPPTLGHEENLLARTKVIELMAKLASQVICGNHTGNCHIKPIVDPTINRR